MARSIFTKDAEKFVPALAEALKKIPEFEVPDWARFVKTGVSRERPPVDDDFWYVRAASILRQLYIRGVVGVGRLRTRYGSKKDRGGRADKFRKSGGKIIRVILQQAETAGLVEKVSRLQYGRRLTQTGRDFLYSINVEEKGVDSSGWTVAPLVGQVGQEEIVEEFEEENEEVVGKEKVEEISEEVKGEVVEDDK